MNTKFITSSIFTVLSASMAQAADVAAPKETEYAAPSVVASPSFSWEGFYFGGQVGGFSSKLSATAPDVNIPLFPDEGNKNKKKKWVPVEKEYLPELSGFVGGFYLGANMDFGNNFILGIDTDILLSGRKATKTIAHYENYNKNIVKAYQDDEAGKDNITFSHSLKEKWVGATRIRIGFAAHHIMPYVSGGIGYGQFQDILSTSIVGKKPFNATSDDTEMMLGYTLGGGVDFAMSNDVILRAEYRYSDFGKKKFKDEIELDYKTNDFRIGVAYKF